jgi:acetyl esterase/lipase
MSLRRHILNASLRVMEKPYLARVAEPDDLRRGFEMKSRFWFRPPRGTKFSTTQINSADGALTLHWARSGVVRDDAMILYFHGGGYVFGSPRTHRAMLARLSDMTGLPACLPQYRLAPENPFPAAIDDALATYRALISEGWGPNRIVLGGDSAGGGLVLALLGEICRLNLPRPAGCFVFSPLTDLKFSGDSTRTNAKADVMLPATRANEMAAMYLQGADPADPRATPLNAIFTDASPVYLAVGDTEILLDDSRRMAEVLQEQGVDVALRIAHNLPHVWPIFQRLLPEADATLHELANWIRLRLPMSAES